MKNKKIDIKDIKNNQEELNKDYAVVIEENRANLFKEYITSSIFYKSNSTEFTVGYRSDYVYYYKICMGKPFIIFDKPHFPTPVVFPCILKKEEFIKLYPEHESFDWYGH